MDDRLLTVAEIAAATRLTEETIRRWLRQRHLRGVCLSRKGGWRVRQSDLDAFMAERANMPAGWGSRIEDDAGHEHRGAGGDSMTLQQALDSSPDHVAVADLNDVFRSRCRVSRAPNGRLEVSMLAGGPLSTLHDVSAYANLKELLDARAYLAKLDWQPA